MNGAEILRDIGLLTRLEEAKRSSKSTINPEVFGMMAILPILSPRWIDFVKRRMAFDVVHLSEQKIDETQMQDWRAIREEIRDYLPRVPKDIGSLTSGDKRIFHDVMQLYGDPHGK